MSEIQTFRFDKNDSTKIRNYKYGFNWPAVYILEDKKSIYIGETTSVYTRSRQHLENPNRAQLSTIHVISDDEFNKSATLDIESWLIQYIAADGKYKVLNGNGGLKNHEYFDREKFKAKFELIWERLQDLSIARQDLVQLRNTDLFKYSPYKSLSDDQIMVVRQLFKRIKGQESGTYLISGKPGTGKTVLAMYLMKYLAQQEETAHMKVGFVVPMGSLRKTLRKVVKSIPGLKQSQVIGPSDVIKEKYDLLIVDEAHRLQRRVNITNYSTFDQVNRFLGLDKEATQLDWVLKSAKHQIFFYDRNQSVRPADVSEDRFTLLPAEAFELTSQLRVEGGEEYIAYIDNLLSLRSAQYFPKKYDFKIYDDLSEMINDVKNHDADPKCGLARVVAGYAWAWKTREGAEYDIEIDGLKLSWNSTNTDWVNSKNAINEVGCIHTIQGYDLNYTGVIVGPEISYDRLTKTLVVDPKKYMDINGKRSISDPNELQKYVVNIYKTLLTRGIKGTYVYIADEALRNFFKESIRTEVGA